MQNEVRSRLSHVSQYCFEGPPVPMNIRYYRDSHFALSGVCATVFDAVGHKISRDLARCLKAGISSLLPSRFATLSTNFHPAAHPGEVLPGSIPSFAHFLGASASTTIDGAPLPGAILALTTAAPNSAMTFSTTRVAGCTALRLRFALGGHNLNSPHRLRQTPNRTYPPL
jgi:hypothetical protein